MVEVESFPRGFSVSPSRAKELRWQDGIRLRGRVDKDFSPHWHGSYGLQNIPGK